MRVDEFARAPCPELLSQEYCFISSRQIEPWFLLNLLENFFYLTAAGAIAVSIPCMSWSGVGGQPGTATSTGMTFDTRPQEA